MSLLSNPPDAPSFGSLADFGWDPIFATHLPPGTIPARVLSSIRNHCLVATEHGERRAEPTGALRFTAPDGGLPVAGDWVAVVLSDGADHSAIVAVLPRKTAVVRRAAGARSRRDGGLSASQVLAANVDTVVICTSVPLDVNIRRLERYLATVWESGAAPVVAVTKADTVTPEALAATVSEIERVAMGAPVVALSVRSHDPLLGMSQLIARAGLVAGHTVAFIGSSGVGKSTIVNALAGAEVMATGAERESDGRGRHTTTQRELLRLSSGLLVLDTPGIRELELWTADSGLDEAFGDVVDSVLQLAKSCRFNDCRHEKEPGCAVQVALADGTLATDRYEAWQRANEVGRSLHSFEKHQRRAVHDHTGIDGFRRGLELIPHRRKPFTRAAYVPPGDERLAVNLGEIGNLRKIVRGKIFRLLSQSGSQRYPPADGFGRQVASSRQIEPANHVGAEWHQENRRDRGDHRDGSSLIHEPPVQLSPFQTNHGLQRRRKHRMISILDARMEAEIARTLERHEGRPHRAFGSYQRQNGSVSCPCIVGLGHGSTIPERERVQRAHRQVADTTYQCHLRRTRHRYRCDIDDLAVAITNEANNRATRVSHGCDMAGSIEGRARRERGSAHHRLYLAHRVAAPVVAIARAARFVGDARQAAGAEGFALSERRLPRPAP